LTGQFTPFIVSQSGAFDEEHSSVAMSPDGRFDIVYEKNRHDDTPFPSSMNLAQYNADGSLISNAPIPFFDGSQPSVAMDNAGNAVVAWEQDTGTSTSDGRRFISVFTLGVASTGHFTFMNQVGSSNVQARNPTIALSPSGGSYVVAYDADLGGVPGNHTVEVSEVDPSNNIVLVANLPALPNNVAPALSIGANFEYLLTFDAGVGSVNRDIHGRFGFLSVGPAAKNLALTPTIQAGESATLTGQLFDADGDTNLTLTVDWGDHSKPQQSQPGTKPFAVTHKYNHAGTYTVHATWTDSAGRSNSRDLTLVVTPRHES
jgi:hypothetical protein